MSSPVITPVPQPVHTKESLHDRLVAVEEWIKEHTIFHSGQSEEKAQDSHAVALPMSAGQGYPPARELVESPISHVPTEGV